MSWNEKDFLRWSAQSYARLGSDVIARYNASNAVLNCFTVPADHIYLLRSMSIDCQNAGPGAASGYCGIWLGAVLKYLFLNSAMPAAIVSVTKESTYPYPMPFLAGYILRISSSAAILDISVSIFYTDVDLTVFPAYDPGY